MTSCACHRFKAPIRSYDDVLDRCKLERAIRASLEVLEVDREGWRELLRCTDCGSHWVSEFPFSERHGGGPACYAVLRSPAPLSQVPIIASRLRSRHDDEVLLETFGPEKGPDACRDSLCERLTVERSVLCSKHHFIMIKKRAPYS